MSAGTSSSGDQTELNSCGLAKSHAYSILSAFMIKENSEYTYMLLARNPWGKTQYNSDWSHADSRWTQNAIS